MKRLSYFLLLLLIFSLTSCGGGAGYKDGTYTGISVDEEQGSSIEVEIIVTDSKISDCKMVARDKEGNVKDENYGKSAGGALYEKAQRAVEGMQEYPELLILAGNPDDVDAVAGATISGQQFKLAVKAALESAQ